MLLSKVALKIALRQVGQKSVRTNAATHISTRTLSSFQAPSFSQNHDSVTGRRYLSKTRAPIDDVDDEDIIHEMDEIRDIKTAGDMEFYDPLTEDFFPEEDLKVSEEIEEAKRQAIRDEIDGRTGRLWEDRLELTDEDWSSGKAYDDLPDWTEKLCSRVSRERVQVHPDGVPTLEKMAEIALPKSAPKHPALGDAKKYVKHRKDVIFQAIYDAVEEFAKPQMERILSMEDWNAKQDAIDKLFEDVHDSLKKSSGDDYVSVVLGNQKNFPILVEKALEQYLQKVVEDEKLSVEGEKAENDGVDADESAVPIFMDLNQADGALVDENGVPKSVYPIKSHKNDGPGRMLEEWELSANEKTKRIMIRQSTREIAKELKKCDGSRVIVSGRQGTGKTADILSTVASARTSGHIVFFMPDANRFRRHGFYVDINPHRKDEEGTLFDLPVLSQEVCADLLEIHGKDMSGMEASVEVLSTVMNNDQMSKVAKSLGLDGEGSISLVELLKVGSENVALSAACYDAVLHTLMNQTSKPFTIVVDEFNTFFDQGHYFHGEYDANVEKSIPLNRITLFKPILDAMGVFKMDDGTINIKEPVPMKNGGIVAGISESHAIAKQITSDLVCAAESNGAVVVEVPHYSKIEVDHILANFEIIGIGRLRFDRGETVMNEQEVAYLRMVSGGFGQPLLDACVH